MPIKRLCISCNKICFSKAHEARCKPCSGEHVRKRKGTVKEYRREHHLKKKYGLDNDDFETLWQVFEGKCAICKINLTMPKFQRGQALSCAVVDHSHITGNFRGLLCNGCNKALGLFKDDPEILKQAERYLKLCEN